MYRFPPKNQVRQGAHSLLLIHSGYAMVAVSRQLMRSLKTICNWKNRWLAEELPGLYDLAGHGRKSKLSEAEAHLARAIIEQVPRCIGQHLSEIKAQTGKAISKTTLKRTLHGMRLLRSVFVNG